MPTAKSDEIHLIEPPSGDSLYVKFEREMMRKISAVFSPKVNLPPPCPACGDQTRFDGHYLMCDHCKRVVGMSSEAIASCE